jgi:hypothetical protein
MKNKNIIVFSKNKKTNNISKDDFDYKNNKTINLFKNIENLSNNILNLLSENNIISFNSSILINKQKEHIKKTLLKRKFNNFEKRYLFKVNSNKKFIRIKNKLLKKIFIKKNK